MSAAAPRLLGEAVCVWPAAAELGEGTCWSVRERSLYWVDILGQRLYRYTPETGERREWRLPDTVSAVAERAAAPGLVITLRRGLATFDPHTGALAVLHEPEPERHGNRFNDGKCDSRGRFWGGTMDFDCVAPTGRLWRFDGRDGRATLALDARYAVTNGPAWSKDGRTMWFNETVERRIHAFDFDPDAGTLGAGRVWLKFSRDDGHPDGMTTDAQGRLWVAHWGASCVTCRDPASGAELLRVPLPASQITNVAFGGPELRTLYVTSARTGLSAERLAAEPLAGGLFAVEVDTPGVPANLYAG